MKDQPESLTPVEAWELCQANSKALLIDIRSSMEHLFIGHPVGSLHVPWIDEPDWTVNPNFVTDIRKLMLGGAIDEADVPIILICRSGVRSKEAGKALVEAGIHNVYHVDKGFEGDLDEGHHRSTKNGWKYSKLPWEQC